MATRNLSRKFEKSGFAALISPDKVTILQIVPVTENQIYNVIGINILFGETKSQLKARCVGFGCTIKEELFS